MTPMTETMKDKTLYIGRNKEDGRLCVLVCTAEKTDCVLIGTPASVPTSVSRCNVSPLSAHCRITFAEDGNLILSNLKSSNITFVGSLSIVEKTISVNDIILLGAERYPVNIGVVLRAVSDFLTNRTDDKLVREHDIPISPTFSLLPLREIWEEYDRKTMEIKKHQRHINLIKGVAPIFTLRTGTLVGLTSWLGWAGFVSVISGSGMGIGVGAMLYGFWLSYRDRSLEENANLVESLQENYVCPNPDCHHFMGMQPYKVISRNKRCPHCKCNYTTN